MITLIYADTGDWVAIYKDGKLLDQAHSFQEDRLLKLLDIEHEAHYDVDIGSMGGFFIANLADLEV